MPKRKNTTVGFETEYFTINGQGELTNDVDRLMKLLRGRKRIHLQLREEVFHSMLEFGASPGKSLREVYLRYLKNLRKAIEVGEQNGIFLLPLTCYPGKSSPRMRNRPWYTTQSKLLGTKKFSDAIRICAFHFHYSLPKGMVEHGTRRIGSRTSSEARSMFLNQYNFLIAADPACITFCQSSPFWEGEHFAKDSRTLLYRDMALETPSRKVYGLYVDHPIFGGLPNYEFTLEDLRSMSIKRKNTYLNLLHSRGLRLTRDVVYSPELGFMWGAIRVNKVGTFEYRGTDMNYPSYTFATAYLLKLALDEIRRQDLQMLPSDIGLKEPFKREGDTVYLPPFSKLKSLEYFSTIYGFENPPVHSYCSALFNFVMKTARKPNAKRLGRIRQMLDSRKTVSDDVLALVAKNGYSPENVPGDFLKYVALYYSKRLSGDIDEAEKMLSGS